jgi:hypothetical protein
MFQPCSQVRPLPNLTHDWSAPPWSHTNSSFEHFRAGDLRIGRSSGNRAQNAISHEYVRQPITRRPAPHDTGCTRRHFLEKALLKRGPQSLATSSVITTRASHMSSPFPRCLSKMGSSVEPAVPLWAAWAYLGDQLARHRRSLTSATAARISSEATVATTGTSILRV